MPQLMDIGNGWTIRSELTVTELSIWHRPPTGAGMFCVMRMTEGGNILIYNNEAQRFSLRIEHIEALAKVWRRIVDAPLMRVGLE